MGRSLVVYVSLLLFLLSLSSILNAAENPVDWNKDWTKFRKVTVQETAGFDRDREPVEAELKYYQPMPSKSEDGLEEAVKRVVRVIQFKDGRWESIPCQVYDIRPYSWNRRAEKPEIMVRARVAFFATVAANSSETFYICYGNPKAPEPRFDSTLSVKGQAVEYSIENPYFSMKTDPKSGQIDTISLKFASKPDFSFRHGNMHWNPDFMYVPEDFPTTWFKWYYAHHFEDPPHEAVNGPIFFEITRSQLVPGQDIAWMNVKYRFYDKLPYFIMESTIETKKPCHTLAIRNDEIAFGSDDYTHAGWRNCTEDMIEGHLGEIGTVDIYNEARMGNHVLGSALPPNIPWISFCHIDRGYAVGSIRLDWRNVNALTGKPSTIYNSHTVISEHAGGLYWFRSLVYPQRDDYNEYNWDADDWRKCCIDIPMGDSYYEKNAYLFYEWDKEVKFGIIDTIWRQLKCPLLVTTSPSE